MVNIQNAISFVKENGDEIEKTRMKCILIGEGAPNDILTELSKIQNPDGGFSYWTKGFSTVFDTIYVLSWLDDLQEQKGEIVDNAFNFLISKQHSDGGWD